MPLDGHAYLVAQGWQGKGSGLRHDAISRPIIVAQKKTLSGIGKDRDEAFPFWDHVFNAAVSSVKIKVYDSDSDDSESSSSGGPALQRTTTGLISNRRPTAGTPALSGTATPTTTSSSSSSSGTSTPKISVLTAAKQAAARRALYSMFFRGPVLANEFEPEAASAAGSDEKVAEAVVAVTEVLEEVELDRVPEKKKRKRERERDRDQVEGGEEEERRRVKREKREKKERRRAEAVASGSTSSKEEKDAEMDEPVVVAVGGAATSEDDREVRKAAKAERKRLRAERRARKEERRRRRAEKDSAPALSPESEPTGSGKTTVGSRLDEGEAKPKPKREKGDKKATEKRKKP